MTRSMLRARLATTNYPPVLKLAVAQLACVSTHINYAYTPNNAMVLITEYQFW